MATKRSKTPSTRTSQPDVFKFELKFPVTMLEYHKRDAVERMQQFCGSLAALVEASSGQMFVVEAGQIALLSRDPLPQDR